MLVSRLLGLLILAFVLGSSATARAETTLQLWTNFMVEWQATQTWLLTFDLEPKRLLVGTGQWGTVDLTQSAEYAPTRWVDLIGELVTGYTNDTENPDSGEVTERLGFRVYPWRKRLQLRDTFRIEQRNRFFDDGTKDHLLRTRNRFEVRYPLNRPRTADPGACIAIADFEYFIPIGPQAEERYASRYRIRAGLGYRWSAEWRVDLLYFYQESRNTFGVDFTNKDHIIDVRFRRAL
jgi:hypothetical protein